MSIDDLRKLVAATLAQSLAASAVVRAETRAIDAAIAGMQERADALVARLRDQDRARNWPVAQHYDFTAKSTGEE